MVMLFKSLKGFVSLLSDNKMYIFLPVIDEMRIQYTNYKPWKQLVMLPIKIAKYVHAPCY